MRVADSPIKRYTCWLVVHEEAYKAPRVRAVLDFLNDACSAVDI